MVRFSTLRLEAQPVVAAVDGDVFTNLTALDPGRYGSLRALLTQGADGLEQARADACRAPRIEGGRVSFLPLVPDATKVLCVGRNYAEHAREQGAEVPGEPLIFAKTPSALRGHGQTVHLPPQSQQVDFEAELVVVIGRVTRGVACEEAMDHVAGFCCGNDVTARDWQKGKPGQQWLLGKSFDTFAPVGPYLVTREEISDPTQLDVCLRLNGEVMQAANTRQMIFPIDYLISYLSQVMTLWPGDLVFTGTPSGVGVAREPPLFLRPGDVMHVEIEGVGCLVNQVQAA